PRPSVRERGAKLGGWLRARGTALREGLLALARRLKRPAMVLAKVLVVALGVAGVIAAGRMLQVHLTTSQAFAIADIEVQGLSRIERDELLQAAGLAPGQNVFTHTPEAVRARLLKHPWIA